MYKEEKFKYITSHVEERYEMVKYMTTLVPIIKPASCVQTLLTLIIASIVVNNARMVWS